MKVLSVQEASGQLHAVCNQALAGETVRLRLENGSLIELLPVIAAASGPPISQEDVAACYDDPEWAKFENGCAAASS